MNHLLLFVLFLGLGTSFARGATLEAYGDSLTSGAFAKTKLVGMTPGQLKPILSDVSLYFITKDSNLLKPYGGPDDVWARFIADRYETLGVPQTVINRAIGGEKSDGLLAQVKKVNYSSAPGTRAFFFVGHNDICPKLNATPDKLASELIANYEKALKQWDSMHQGATAYILPLGNMTQLYETLYGYVWYESPTHEKYTCDANWNLYFPFCPPLAKFAKEGKIREVLTPRLELINRRLSQMALEFSKSSERNRYVFLERVYDSHYVKDYAAVDCFHLSPQGQHELSNNIWKELRANE